MNWETALDPTLSARLCLALLHSLWQVTLLTALVWGFERLWRHRSVEKSYALHVAALLAGLAAMPVTYALVDVSALHAVSPSEPGAVSVVAAQATSPVRQAPAAADAPQPPQGTIDPAVSIVPVAAPSSVPATPARVAADGSAAWQTAAAWTVAVYALGVLLMLARLARGLWYAHRLAAHASPLNDGPVAELLHSLARHWSMRVTPALAVAERVVVPKVVGLLRPTILLPASAVTGLSPDELQMILAHELAHIRRHDLWVNLLQRLAETLLFFNPALWYLTRRISMLREYCCDELTCRTMSAAAGDTPPSDDSRPPLAVDPRTRYAAALLRVAELSRRSPPPSELTTLAATGRSPSELRCRVAHLFGEPLNEPLRLSRGLLWSCVVIALFFSFALPLLPIGAQTNERQDGHATVDSSDEFSFGSKVEVVAIGTTDGFPQQWQWWDSRGRVMDSVPFTWSPAGKVVSDGVGRRIVYRIDMLPDDAAVKWEIVGCRGSADANVTPEGKQDTASYFSRYFIVPADQETVQLRVGVATGAWRTETRMDVTGTQARAVSEKKKSLVYSGAIDTPNGTVAVVSHNYFDHNFRVVAVDKYGAPHNSMTRGGASAGEIYQTRATFPYLTISGIDHIEFQTRDYEWVEINNLPLHPRNAKAEAPAPPADDAIGASPTSSTRAADKVGPLTLQISGTCKTTDGQPIRDAEVRLYHRDEISSYEVPLLQSVRTDESGRYEFEKVAYPSTQKLRAGDPHYAVAVSANGFGSTFKYVPIRIAEMVDCDFSLKKAATLQGRVTGPDAAPIEGADVWIVGIGLGPLDGVLCCKTDAEGRFEIPDVARWNAGNSKDRDPQGRFGIGKSTQFFRVHHPDYGTRIGQFTSAPSTVDVKLELPAIIEGRVIFADSGESAAGILVRACSQSGYTIGSEYVRTDHLGIYRFLLPESHYNFWAHHDELTVQAIEGYNAKSGRTHRVPDLQLIKGGLVEGQLVDAKSGEPVSLRDDDVAQLTIRGPARPRSSGAAQAEPIHLDGSFRFRLPPGKSRLALYHYSYGSFQLKIAAKVGGTVFHEVDVADGETIKLELDVVRVAKQVQEDAAEERKSVPSAAPAEGGRKNSEPEDSIPAAEAERTHLNVVIARHVVLWEGREIVTWEEVEERIAALPDPSLAHPRFYVTSGAHAAGKKNALADFFRKIHRVYDVNQRTQGVLPSRADWRYDHVDASDDLVPDESLRVDAKIVDDDGKPVEGAEVVLVAWPDESLASSTYGIFLVEGRIRNPLQEVMTHSNGAGEFVLYPPSDQNYYVLGLHPEHGFALTPNSEFAHVRLVKLVPWAGLASGFSTEPVEQEAKLSSHVPQAEGRPEVTFVQYSSDLNERNSELLFHFNHVPPTYQTTIFRVFPKRSARSITTTGASVALRPGESRRIDLGP